MKRRLSAAVSALAIATGALILTSCATPQTRISDHPELYQSLSPRNRALVSQGQIGTGMPKIAVWLAWGLPDQKIVSNMGGRRIETWFYVCTRYPAPCYGPWNPYFGAPLFYPFYDSEFPPPVPYPCKVVTFATGRVVSFYYVASH
jgi:hypothetical protein